MKREVVGAALAMAALAGSTRARADNVVQEPPRAAQQKQEVERPYTLVELAGGVLTLPDTEVCRTAPTPGQPCPRGEISLTVGIRNIFRFGRFGVGAGIQWATTLQNDQPRNESEQTNERQHSRRYFLFEALGRYSFIRKSPWEVWAGPTFGAIIVNDSWTLKLDRQPYSDAAIVGPRAATIGTEGVTTGLAVGGVWTFATNWELGGGLRYSIWFLPSTRETSPTGDTASLSGRVHMIDIGLSIAYRIPL